MPPMDQTGRNLHKGQLVHVMLNGMFTALVDDILDSKVLVSGQQPMPPVLVLAIEGLMVPIVQNHASVYIVKAAEEPAKIQAPEAAAKVPEESLNPLMEIAADSKEAWLSPDAVDNMLEYVPPLPIK